MATTQPTPPPVGTRVTIPTVHDGLLVGRVTKAGRSIVLVRLDSGRTRWFHAVSAGPSPERNDTP